MILFFAYIDSEKLIVFFFQRVYFLFKEFVLFKNRNACNVDFDVFFHVWVWSRMIRIKTCLNYTRDREFENFIISWTRCKMLWLLTNHSSHIFVIFWINFWFKSVQSVIKAHSRFNESNRNELFRMIQLEVENQYCWKDRRWQDLWNCDTRILCSMTLLFEVRYMLWLQLNDINQKRHLNS